MRPKLLLARMHASEVRENGEIDRHGQRSDKIIQGDSSGRGLGRVELSDKLCAQFYLDGWHLGRIMQIRDNPTFNPVATGRWITLYNSCKTSFSGRI